MKNDFYGRFFLTMRAIVRFFIPTYHYDPLPEKLEDKPIVLVAHHQNMIGPISLLLSLSENYDIRVWAFSPFFDRKETYEHVTSFTFTKRFGWPKYLSKLIGKPYGILVEKLLKSVRGIPVYRKSRQIIETMNLSVEALNKNQMILIFPNVDYSLDESHVGQIYEGFLNIHRYFQRDHQEKVYFLPIISDYEKKKIRYGQAVTFNDENDFMTERSKIAKKLQKSMNELLDQ